MDASFETRARARCFEGTQGVYAHRSEATGTTMEFAVYLPPRAERAPVPVLWWLSGLTCTWENFIVKAGAQRYAAEHGVALVAPDTSPRGTNLPGEHDAYDFGSGAGFYVDAAEAPWAAHYRMYTYVTEELPRLVAARFPVDPDRQGIFGHSMGGHGAPVAALRNPGRYRSVSAFAPIAAPSQVPWGEKAFARYLGADRARRLEYDAAALVAKAGWDRPIRVDQGDADGFLDTQLRPWLFEQACREAGVALDLRTRAGYDHGYYFVASFVGEHVAHHARALGARGARELFTSAAVRS